MRPDLSAAIADEKDALAQLNEIDSANNAGARGAGYYSCPSGNRRV